MLAHLCFSNQRYITKLSGDVGADQESAPFFYQSGEKWIGAYEKLVDTLGK